MSVFGWIKRHPAISTVSAIGGVFIALVSFTEATTKAYSGFAYLFPEAAQSLSHRFAKWQGGRVLAELGRDNIDEIIAVHRLDLDGDGKRDDLLLSYQLKPDNEDFALTYAEALRKSERYWEILLRDEFYATERLSIDVIESGEFPYVILSVVGGSGHYLSFQVWTIEPTGVFRIVYDSYDHMYHPSGQMFVDGPWVRVRDAIGEYTLVLDGDQTRLVDANQQDFGVATRVLTIESPVEARLGSQELASEAKCIWGGDEPAIIDGDYSVCEGQGYTRLELELGPNELLAIRSEVAMERVYIEGSSLRAAMGPGRLFEQTGTGESVINFRQGHWFFELVVHARLTSD
ncbi:MAG: hypothetical protein AAGF94_06555 [Pseudomonadota bacterium]